MVKYKGLRIIKTYKEYMKGWNPNCWDDICGDCGKENVITMDYTTYGDAICYCCYLRKWQKNGVYYYDPEKLSYEKAEKLFLEWENLQQAKNNLWPKYKILKESE